MRELLRPAIDKYLQKHPYWTSYKGVKVKVCSMTDIPAKKRLKNGLGYINEWIIEDSPRVICDLGCNIGLFPLWLYASTGIKVRGLFIDANYSMILRARENLRINNFKEVQIEYGLVGEPLGSKFYVNTSHQSSSCYTPHDNTFNQFSPPTIDVEGMWGDKEGDLLKVDIEGSELGFLKTISSSFLRRFKKIIVEYHEPICSSAMVQVLMKPHGFKLEAVDIPLCGNTYWVRR